MKNTNKTHKICSKCKKNLPISHFSPRKVSSDGYRGQCKSCVNSYRQEWARRAVNTETLDPELFPKHRCSECKEIKSELEFDYSSQNLSGIKHTCKKCKSKQWKNYTERFES